MPDETRNAACTPARYRQLVERSRFELKQAIDCARSPGLPESRRQRLVWVGFDLSREAEELKRAEEVSYEG